MRSCDDLDGAIARRADGAPESPEERARLDAHLETCAGCRAALDAQRAIRGILQSREPETLSPAFASRLAERLDEATGWFGLIDWRVWTFRLAPVAAGLALAAYLTAGGSATSTPSVTLDTWARGTAATSQSGEALLWQEGVTSESLLESMLTGGSTGSTSDVR